MKFFKLKTILFLIAITAFIIGGPVFASSTNGTIDSTYKYVWGENIGWLNFGCDNCNVHITDSGLSGYALAENIGWLYLGDITNNNGGGTLSGNAWSENAGWIKFNPDKGGVIINSSGEFTGSALGENIGWIIFGGDYKVKTDWRPQSARPACNNSSDDDGDGKTDYPSDPGCSSLDDTNETDIVTGGGIPGSAGGGSSVPEPKAQTISPEGVVTYLEKPIVKIEEALKPIIEKAPEILKLFIPEFLKPRKPPAEERGEPKPPEEIVAKETPQSMKGKWQLLPSGPIREFVLAPLPKEIRELAEKFPELGETLKKVGISKITDVAKLKTVKLTLPGLREVEQIPTEIVFAKTGGEKIDFSIALSIAEKGQVQQKITTISGKPLQLSTKPDKPVKSVKGYVVFRSKPQKAELELPQNSLLASLIFAFPVFASNHNPAEIETRLVLLEFEYTDSDGDGIYTAEIQAPLADGEYEIITVMDYEDPKLGAKEIRLITVVDPEGYIYTKINEQELRIKDAIISLYRLNRETRQYELWPAREYQQENPQITDVRGTYSFLVPEGTYNLKTEAPGYLVYESKAFEVKEGSGIHMNIELKSKSFWLRFDWRTVLLISIAILLAIVAILLLYNFYRDKIRERQTL